MIRKASDDEIKFSKTPDPTLENQEVTYKWLNQARNVAKILDFEIQTINDVPNFIQNHPEQDEGISEFIEKSSYLEQYKCDLKLNPYRYDSDEFVEYFLEKKIPLEDAIDGELQKEPSLIDHIYRNHSVHSQMHEVTNFKYHALHITLYSNILLLIKDRLVIMYTVMPAPINVKLKSDIYLLIQIIDQIVI